MEPDGKYGDSNERYDKTPTPENFNKFFPWACRNLGIEDTITISNIQSSYANKQRQRKQKSAQQPLTSVDTLSQINSFKISDTANYVNNIHITTVCDENGNLLQLKFEKNIKISRTIFKILALILKYHVYLTAISINQGIDGGSLYELEKLTKLSITDLCLDGTRVNSENYDLLLETQNNLKNLSIARCNIDDIVVKKIAEKLQYDLPASKMLTLLNLASNKITDSGAKHLAYSLRSNRCLVYLNLSGNTITDNGMFAILEILDQFKVCPDEIKKCRKQRLEYLKENQPPTLNIQRLKRMTMVINKKNMKPMQELRGNKQKQDKQEVNKTVTTEYFDDGFSNPFSRNNTVLIDGQIYCTGNNSLAYLNTVKPG